MKLIIGLGNPGNEYINTRHNIGFMFLNNVYNGSFSLNNKMNAYESICFINDEKVIIIKPLSFMNLSGDVVLKYVNYYKVDFDNILVIQDDLDMPVGKYKILFNRGDGGHNGIKDIINKLGTKNFYRLKIGISKCIDISTKDYVLGVFSNDELDCINKSFAKLNNIIYDFVNLSRNDFVQKYNTKVDD